jgi:hypothetical protein
MTPAQFRRRVYKEAEGTGVPRHFVTTAIDTFLSDGRREESDVLRCRRQAQSLFVNLTGSKEAEARLGGPNIEIDSGEMIKHMTPEVERLRRKLFNEPKAPFPSLGRAAEWIENTAAERTPRSEADRILARQLQAEILQKIQCLRRISNVHLALSHTVNVLRYVKPDSAWESNVTALPESALDDLAKSSESLANSTGFSAAGIVAYILVGIPPVLPFARISLPSHLSNIGSGDDERNFRRVHVRLELNSTDITRKQFRRLYEVVRSTARMKHRKPLAQRHLALLKLIETLGGVPTKRGALTPFWRSARKTWNDAHPDWRLKTPDALRLAYKRLQDELGTRKSM